MNTIIELNYYNPIHVQKYFNDMLQSPHNLCSGYIIGYNYIGDTVENSKSWLKIRKTTMDINTVRIELSKKYNIIFTEKTEYLNKCKMLIELLFTYAKSKRINSDGKNEEWFYFQHYINPHRVLLSIIALMNDKPLNNTNNNLINNQTENDKLTLQLADNVNGDNDDDFFTGLLTGASSVIISGLIAGAGILLTDLLTQKSEDIPKSVRQGISTEIHELISLKCNEHPLYHYTSNNIYILLTDLRFVKIENYQIVSQTFIENIKCVNHIKNSIFSFDKVETIEKNDRQETFGIYEKEVCAFFIKIIRALISNYPKKCIKDKHPVKTITIECIEDTQKCFRCDDKYTKSTIKTIKCTHVYICHHCLLNLSQCPICKSYYEYN